MLKVTRDERGSGLAVRFSGTIDETTDFAKLIGPVETELRVNCKEVVRINSAGVRSWIVYFQELADRHVKLRFQECSPPIVEQVNFMMNFCAGSAIESVCVPYLCDACKRQFVIVLSVDDLRVLGTRLPQVACPKCGGSALFDEMEEEYLAFTRR